LSYMPATLHDKVGEKIRQALVVGGSFVMATSLGTQQVPVDATSFSTDVLKGLAKNGVRLPPDEAEFKRLLVAYSGYQRNRLNPWATVAELASYLKDHGLEANDFLSKNRGTGYTANGECMDRSTPGVIVTARRAA
jgi:hypothetical protein